MTVFLIFIYFYSGISYLEKAQGNEWGPLQTPKRPRKIPGILTWARVKQPVICGNILANLYGIQWIHVNCIINPDKLEYHYHQLFRIYCIIIMQ